MTTGYRHIERTTTGRVTITDSKGIRVFNSDGKELAAVDGNRDFYIRIARECLELARLRD